MCVRSPGGRYPVFLAVLEYLYTDKVELTPELAVPLLAAADFLGVGVQLSQMLPSSLQSDALDLPLRSRQRIRLGHHAHVLHPMRVVRVLQNH